ncbi:MAG: Flp family type IVb pilin [Dehalococcoidia bacterium]|nr:Flp family type IVb pilin [Dehalococcoidia bacterium]
MSSAIQYAYAWLVSHLRGERGQDLIEYALLSGLLAIAIMAAVMLLTQPIADMAAGIGRCIDFQSTSTCVPW